MSNSLISRAATSLVVIAILVTTNSHLAQAEIRSKAFVNGRAEMVFYNDGDSFRILTGPSQGTKARLGGFNTLESHGAVHRFGDWTYKELYHNAKMATIFSRRGVWSCTTDGERDTYGRSLMICPGLAIALISQGLAHAYSVDHNPARPDYLEVQKEAMDAGRGMWAHGKPEYIITSVHSADERPDHEFAYNRVVSTVDGHSEKWKHKENYPECTEICVPLISISEEVYVATVAALKSIDELKEFTSTYTDPQLRHVAHTWLKLNSVATFVDESAQSKFRTALEKLSADKVLVGEKVGDESCTIHVAFEGGRRFGPNKAKCLK